MSRLSLLPAVCALLLLPFASSAAESLSQLNEFSRAVQSLSAQVSPSVVRITATRADYQDGYNNTAQVASGRQQSIGSGVIVDPSGYILTNAHVIEGAQKIRVDLVTAGEKSVSAVLERYRIEPQDATLVGIFKEGDIALLKIARTGLPALHFADYNKLEQGQVVFAFGSPEGLQNSVSMGVVSSIARQPDIDSPFLYIQTDTAINPGNSGGPLVNAAGEIVGLNTFIFSKSGGNEGVGFAIPSSLLSWVGDSLRKHGHVDRISVGLGVQTLTPTLARALKLTGDTGIVISDVLPNGPADMAGLRFNDLLVSIDGKPISSVPAMMGLFFREANGKPLHFEVLRDGKSVCLDIVPIQQEHQVDRLSSLSNPEHDAIASLGILGANVDSRVQALVGTLRLPTGVIVTGLSQSALPVNAGFQTGDVIHALNGDFVSSLDALRNGLADRKPGEPVAVLIERAGKLQYLSFEL